MKLILSVLLFVASAIAWPTKDQDLLVATQCADESCAIINDCNELKDDEWVRTSSFKVMWRFARAWRRAHIFARFSHYQHMILTVKYLANEMQPI
jgi:hypothetical protein